MKGYTDINQSRKLAEILPLESADMSFRPYRKEGGISDYQADLCPYRFASWIGIPCWSLTALLGLIPNWTMDKTDKLNLTCNPHGHCESCYEDPVDAAFEMIVWLKENGKL